MSEKTRSNLRARRGLQPVGAKSAYIWKVCIECGEEFIARRAQVCQDCQRRKSQRKRTARRKAAAGMNLPT